MSSLRKPITATAAAAILLTACSHDGIDGEVDMTHYEFVTLNSSTPSGSTFELVGPDNSGSTFLHSTRSLDPEQFPDGTRLIIAYTGPSGSGNSEIDLRSAVRIFNAPLRDADAGDLSAPSDPIYLMSMWRTGSFLNIRAMLPASSQPRIWRLVIDPATASDPVPCLRLIHRLPDGLTTDDTYMASSYSSFDISSLTSTPTATAFTVELLNSNLPSLSTLTFKLK